MYNIEENKKVLKQALNQSFVDDYKAYRTIVDNINEDFKNMNIEYEWTYDNFCVEFLEESMKKLETIDIFQYTNNFDEFYKNFWNFNLIVVKKIIEDKVTELGYDDNILWNNNLEN